MRTRTLILSLLTIVGLMLLVQFLYQSKCLEGHMSGGSFDARLGYHSDDFVCDKFK